MGLSPVQPAPRARARAVPHGDAHNAAASRCRRSSDPQQARDSLRSALSGAVARRTKPAALLAHDAPCDAPLAPLAPLLWGRLRRRSASWCRCPLPRRRREYTTSAFAVPWGKTAGRLKAPPRLARGRSRSPATTATRQRRRRDAPRAPADAAALRRRHRAARRQGIGRRLMQLVHGELLPKLPRSDEALCPRRRRRVHHPAAPKRPPRPPAARCGAAAPAHAAVGGAARCGAATTLWRL